MPLVLQMFFRLLGASIVPLAWKLLAGVGFGVVAFTGVSVLMDQAKAYVFDQVLSLPTEWVQLFGLLKVDVCINLMFSAYVARAVLWGMNRSGGKSQIRFMPD